MIPVIRWTGALNKTEGNIPSIRFCPLYGTITGICSWVAPLSKPMKSPKYWPKGALSGKNNGVTIYLDTESYDYVADEDGGLGFHISVIHPLDTPTEQSSISVSPGSANHLGVSVTLTSTSEVWQLMHTFKKNDSIPK